VKVPTIGELRRRLLIEEATEAADGAGGAVRTFAPVATVFARIEPTAVREAVDDGRQVGRVTHRITIRRRNDVAGGMRFSSGAVRYRVLAVEPCDDRRRFIVCLCEEEQK
jgi:SPP1 family predicted phage head-tail adaptor